MQKELAKALALREDQVRVVAPPVGGGFGGKLELFQHEAAAAKLAMLTGRPVKAALNREEVFYCHRGRHPVLMWVKSGWTSDGKITGIDFQSFVDGGAYTSYGAASLYYTGALQTVCEHVPAYRWQGVRVLTNKPPCGPKRGHGTPQPRFALECHFDAVAERLAHAGARAAPQEFSRAVFQDRQSPADYQQRPARMRRTSSRANRSSKPATANCRSARVSASPSARTCAARGCRCTGTTCRTAPSTSAWIAAGS